MADWLKQVQAFLWENKEGAIIGGVLGYLFITPLLTKDASALQSLQSVGLVDVLKSASTSAVVFARTKAVWLGVILGSIIGIIVDSLIPEGFWKRWF